MWQVRDYDRRSNCRCLVLVSETKHPESIRQLTEFIGWSFLGKRVLYIPTAANGEASTVVDGEVTLLGDERKIEK